MKDSVEMKISIVSAFFLVKSAQADLSVPLKRNAFMIFLPFLLCATAFHAYQ